MDSTQAKCIVRILASVLDRLVSSNDASGEGQEITRFHAQRVPSISVHDYLSRVQKYSACSAECFVLALIYIDRLIQMNSFVVNSLNVHRVIITSVMLGAKFFDDQYYNNAYYARVGGVPTSEMNALEIEFLFLVNFSLHVTPEAYRNYFLELRNHALLIGPSAGLGGAVCESVTSVEPTSPPLMNAHYVTNDGRALIPTASPAPAPTPTAAAAETGAAKRKDEHRRSKRPRSKDGAGAAARHAPPTATATATAAT
eukprot:CAMPEP_0196772278 /NCGR_PEP_ID=MMETSP1104-20130614/2147_1 /TAXON_ID=33652 /ORGANISM="Cafeteria sp., Strain Caron Lab Isolate" /LENGTH=255 /DNA_ID=CAMNT_0042142411 /DNA_START=173 /DNA_END=937 /DNA_ORIENTATION=+